VVLAALMMVVILAMVAIGIDVGMIVLARTQLQVSADAAAMAAAATMHETRADMMAEAREFSASNRVAGVGPDLQEQDVEYGVWDLETRTFAPTLEPGNAVRVTVHRDSQMNGGIPLFFARIFGKTEQPITASAVAMANPRDICFVVDLSGSMNDDTEPCWATDTINTTFTSYPTVGADLMADVYEDFGYGSYPGARQYIGESLGVPSDQYAYSEMTKDDGYLNSAQTDPTYFINPTDTEAQRKVKAYQYMILHQIAVVMPGVAPSPTLANYAYWERYLDYIIRSVSITPPPSGGGGGGSGGGGGGGGGGPPPSPPPPSPPSGFILPTDDREWAYVLGAPAIRDDESVRLTVALGSSGAWEHVLLPSLATALAPRGTPPNNRGSIPPRAGGSRRITDFNNPNSSTYPSASSSLPRNHRNWIGYQTYVQFMMDHGRSQSVVPGSSVYTPLSAQSADCPRHSEATEGGLFSFPPREQPTHACRRSLIAAMQVVKERNESITVPGQRDWVSVVSFDVQTGTSPTVVQPLTADYDAAMTSCTNLQAYSDVGNTTATEAGLDLGRQHIRPTSQGGAGREHVNKIIVLLTDGVPNLVQSPVANIDQYMTDHPNSEWYGGGYYWLDAPLMQADEIRRSSWWLYPVGIGLGTDYNFMDKMARLGDTADDSGQSARGSGNPAEYEERLKEIFTRIIQSPKVRLVK
jgi:hypothetical protein